MNATFDFTKIEGGTKDPLISPIKRPSRGSWAFRLEEGSKEEKLAIQRAIATAHLRLETIGEGISKCHRLLDHLLSESEKTEAFIHQHRCLISPINNLPPEILSRIIVEASRKEMAHGESPRAMEICRTWNEICLGTPQLWSTIVIKGRKSLSKPAMEQADRFLQRSKGYLLTLDISFHKFHVELSQLLLKSNPDRWRSVKFMLPFTYYQDLQARSNSTYPNLTSCDLSIVGARPPQGLVFNTFADAERLHSIVLHNNILTQHFPLPLAEVRSWAGHPYSLDFISQSPKLESLSLGLGELRTAGTVRPTTPHPALTTLHLDCSLATFNHDIPLDLFPPFPHLQRFFFFANKAQASVPNLVPWFKRSGTQLTVLVFSVNTPIDTLRECLSHAPSLSVLHVNRVTGDVLDMLTIQDDDSVNHNILPKLRSLRFSGKVGFSPSQLEAMVRSRFRQQHGVVSAEVADKGQVSNLEILRLLPDRSVRDIRDRFSDMEIGMCREGLDMKVRGHDWNIFTDRNYLFNLEDELNRRM